MDSAAMLMWNVLFGGIGVGYFIYGKKQRKPVPLVTGIALFGYSYLMPNITALVLVGLALIAVPRFIKI
jgi:hypothetical protein